MFPDGEVQQYSANVIAQSIYESADEDGHRYQLLDEIVGHRRLKEAVDKSNETLSPRMGKRSGKLLLKDGK